MGSITHLFLLELSSMVHDVFFAIGTCFKRSPVEINFLTGLRLLAVNFITSETSAVVPRNGAANRDPLKMDNVR